MDGTPHLELSGNQDPDLTPDPQRLPIFHLTLGGRSESLLLRKPVFSLSKGVKVLLKCAY